MGPVEAEVLMSTKEAAAFMGLQPATLNWWRHVGTGARWGRLGQRKVVYKRSELIRFIEAGFDDGKASA